MTDYYGEPAGQDGGSETKTDTHALVYRQGVYRVVEMSTRMVLPEIYTTASDALKAMKGTA